MNTTENEKSKVRHDLEQRRVLISASLVSILVLVSLTNQNLMNQYQKIQGVDKGARYIASVSDSVRKDHGIYAWQKSLADKIAVENIENRDLASVGRRPSAFEELRFGVLEGKYSFQLEDGKIKSIEFVDSDSTSDRPKYINDKVEFLNKNKDLFVYNFAKATKSQEIASGSLISEVYKLYGKDQKLVGQVRFTSDLEGRARTIKTEPAN